MHTSNVAAEAATAMGAGDYDAAFVDANASTNRHVADAYAGAFGDANANAYADALDYSAPNAPTRSQT